MTAFWRRSRASTVTDPNSVVGASTPPPTFRSRALTYLLEGRPRDRPWRILDLGPPNQTNLEFFTQLGAKYSIEDLYRSLEPFRQGLEIDVGQASSKPGILEFDEGTRFDLVLAWDLLNFLPRELLTWIGERLTPYSHDRTEVYALLSMEATIPGQPGRPMVVDRETVRVDGWQEPRNRSWPRHNPTALTEAMDGWVVDKTFLLKIHMHEVLLERGPESGDSEKTSRQ